MFHEAFDRATLAGRIAAFEQDQMFRAGRLRPVLKLQQLDLQRVLLILVRVAVHPIVVRIIGPPGFIVIGEFRGVQFTPPRSQCSISFGRGLTTATPGSAQRLELVVSDIDAARENLISCGVEVSELFHRDESGLAPGPDPQRRSYFTYAAFRDPDGNGWLLQEIKERLPGREWED